MVCSLLGEEPFAEFVEAAMQAVADGKHLQTVRVRVFYRWNTDFERCYSVSVIKPVHPGSI